MVFIWSPVAKSLFSSPGDVLRRPSSLQQIKRVCHYRHPADGSMAERRKWKQWRTRTTTSAPVTACRLRSILFILAAVGTWGRGGTLSAEASVAPGTLLNHRETHGSPSWKASQSFRISTQSASVTLLSLVFGGKLLRCGKHELFFGLEIVKNPINIGIYKAKETLSGLNLLYRSNNWSQFNLCFHKL